MGKRGGRKRTGRKNAPKPVAGVLVQEKRVPEGTPVQDLLFKPLASMGSRGSVDFEHITVPFKVSGNNVFVIYFMDSMGTSVYIQLYGLEDGVLPHYEDVSGLMKECLEMQEQTGVEYYFGKLNSAVNSYLYALNLFVDKDLLDVEKALDLVNAIGMDTSEIASSVQYVQDKLDKTAAERAAVRARNNVGAGMGAALSDLLTKIFAGKDVMCSDPKGDAEADTEAEAGVSADVADADGSVKE